MSDTELHDGLLADWSEVRKSAEARTQIITYTEFINRLSGIPKPSIAIRTIINEYEQKLDKVIKNG